MHQVTEFSLLTIYPLVLLIGQTLVTALQVLVVIRYLVYWFLLYLEDWLAVWKLELVKQVLHILCVPSSGGEKGSVYMASHKQAVLVLL